MSTASPPDGRLERLHPLTPLLKSFRVVGTAVAVVSLRTLLEVGVVRALAVTAALVALTLVGSWVLWRFTGYRVAERELHIHDGILSRRHRTVPLERVQAVDVVRPFLARLLGLAELRLEVVGSGKTEAPLAYLPVTDAVHLRERLLAHVATPVAPRAEKHPTHHGERVLFAVDPHELLLSQILTTSTLALPLLAVFPIAGLFVDGITIVAVITTLSGVVGLVLMPVRRVFAEYGFTVTTTPAGLRLRHGLVETRVQTVPPGRLQALRIVQPPLWRLFGWVRVEMDIAGYGVPERDENRRTNALVPVARPEVAYALAHEILAEFPAGGPEVLAMVPAPPAARWLDPLRAPRLAVAITDMLFVSRGGWLRLEHVVAVRERAQSVRVSRGPLQRRLGLASVHLDPAAGHTAPTARHRDLADALKIAELLSQPSVRSGRATSIVE